jgi:hypothetical protein
VEKHPKTLAEVKFVPDMTKTGIKVTPSGQITIGKDHAGRMIKQLFIIFEDDGPAKTTEDTG